jgi:hypothetical protein
MILSGKSIFHDFLYALLGEIVKDREFMKAILYCGWHPIYLPGSFSSFIVGVSTIKSKSCCFLSIVEILLLDHAAPTQ